MCFLAALLARFESFDHRTVPALLPSVPDKLNLAFFLYQFSLVCLKTESPGILLLKNWKQNLDDVMPSKCSL